MSLVHHVIIVLFGMSGGSLAFALARIPIISRPSLGLRGARRTLALRRSLFFRASELSIRIVASWWREGARARWLGSWARTLHTHQSAQLEHAGHFLGLTPDEYTSLSLLSMVGLLCLGALTVLWLDTPFWLIAACSAFGLALPYLRIASVIRARRRKIRRDLPTAIDLAAMCVNAGLDFPGALRVIAQEADDNDLVAQELTQLLAALHLGHTRRYALSELERRVPIDSIRSFVRELIQAEEKGNPIAEALTVQASISRDQRSIAAEEAAARAGVLMIVPMMLLLGCILLMLMGPFIVGGMGL